MLSFYSNNKIILGKDRLPFSYEMVKKKNIFYRTMMKKAGETALEATKKIPTKNTVTFSRTFASKSAWPKSPSPDFSKEENEALEEIIKLSKGHPSLIFTNSQNNTVETSSSLSHNDPEIKGREAIKIESLTGEPNQHSIPFLKKFFLKWKHFSEDKHYAATGSEKEQSIKDLIKH